MGKKSDVKVSVTGLSGTTPTGVTITYAVGQIPVATVDFSPGSSSTASTGSYALDNADSLKRTEISINVSVLERAGNGQSVNKTLTFEGLLDGVSMGNIVGQTTYQAVVKNKAQTLLELTTYTPGIHPAGLNIYKIPAFALKQKNQAPESESVKAWNMLIEEFGKLKGLPPVKFYTELLKILLDIQKNKASKFTGRSLLVDQEVPFEKIFSSANYQRALGLGLELLNSIDTSAVDGTPVSMDTPAIQTSVREIFISGPNVLLENYMNFLSTFGCTLIFANSKIFVVPINSVLKQQTKVPARGALSSPGYNFAGPSDYNSYSYSDVGYRDIACVLVTASGNRGGTNPLGLMTFDANHIAHFAEEEGLSKASGVLVVNSHLWMSYISTGYFATDSKNIKQQMDNRNDSMHSTSLKYNTVTDNEAKQKAARQKEKDSTTSNSNKEILTNYAETKFYQARFADRTGSISMSFNPKWVPGTGGVMYVRGTNTFLAFYVNSVTHRIEIAAPNTGSATTVVNFCCGRVGTNPAGTNQDAFLKYDSGKEKAVQAAFTQNIKAS